MVNAYAVIANHSHTLKACEQWTINPRMAVRINPFDVALCCGFYSLPWDQENLAF
jgi:hypothetical protein